MKTIIIYTLVDSRYPNDIRYVGKTTQTLNKRLSGHKTEAKKALSEGYTLNYKDNWMNKVLKEGGTIIIQALDEITIEDDESWEWLEQYWISQLKTWGFNLVNLTDGGDGNHGQVFTKESIEKRASKIRGIQRPQLVRLAISKGNLGKSKSEEHKKHVKESMSRIFGIPIVQLDKKTKEFIAEYDTITQAAELLGKSKANIAKCCNHTPHFNTAYGYIWLYKDEYIVLSLGNLGM